MVKADLPDVNPQDLDIRVENNILTIRGERKFEAKVHDDNYLRIERAYGSFSRSFSLANSVNSEALMSYSLNSENRLLISEALNVQGVSASSDGSIEGLLAELSPFAGTPTPRPAAPGLSRRVFLD